MQLFLKRCVVETGERGQPEAADFRQKKSRSRTKFRSRSEFQASYSYILDCADSLTHS